MSDIPTLLANIPDEFKPMAAIGMGSLMLVGLVLLHGAGLYRILTLQRRREQRLRLGPPSVAAAAFLFGWSVFLMLGLHILGILFWAFALNQMGLVAQAHNAIYFSGNAYTTLGYGNVDVGEHWRDLTPIIGLSGLFTFAWTTSALADVVASNGRLLKQQAAQREREIQMRIGLAKEAWDAVKKERAAVQSERGKIRTQLSGASFLELCKIWKQERTREAGLRRAVRAGIAERRRKERQEEAKLSAPGAPPPPGSKDEEQP
jgi:hypothetical protein